MSARGGVVGHSAPMGLEVRKEGAVRVLKEIYAETLKAVASEAKPTGRGGFELWCHAKDERLSILDAAIRHYESLPTSAVVVRGDE